MTSRLRMSNCVSPRSARGPARSRGRDIDQSSSRDSSPSARNDKRGRLGSHGAGLATDAFDANVIAEIRAGSGRLRYGDRVSIVQAHDEPLAGVPIKVTIQEGVRVTYAPA